MLCLHVVTIVGPGNGSPSVTNVVVVVVLLSWGCCYQIVKVLIKESVVLEPIAMKLFTHTNIVNGNILHRTTVAHF